MKKILVFAIFVLILSSCSPATPSVNMVQTAIAQTQLVLPIHSITPQPSAIPTETRTPMATFTSTPTLTPTTTSTSTLTLTPTVTNTATPVPPATLTQQALNATQTERANIANSTQAARDNAATASAKSITQTAYVKASTSTEIASYVTIYWKELATYPDNYIGKKVVVTGRVFHVLGSVVQIYFAGTYEALYVTLRTSPSGIYDNDAITVYGVVKGRECFTNAYDAQICQPALKDAWYTKP